MITHGLKVALTAIPVAMAIFISCKQQDRTPKEKYLNFEDYCIKYFYEFRNVPERRGEYADDIFGLVNDILATSDKRFIHLTEHAILEMLGEPDEKYGDEHGSTWKWARKNEQCDYDIRIDFSNEGLVTSARAMNYSRLADERAKR